MRVLESTSVLLGTENTKILKRTWLERVTVSQELRSSSKEAVTRRPGSDGNKERWQELYSDHRRVKARRFDK